MPILAHASGIDDILLFVIPAVAAIAAMRWAEIRARKRADRDDPLGPDPPGT